MIPLRGAVPASGPDAGVAWHYGEPLRESRALAQGEGFADLSHLGVVSVSGPDRLTWLHTLTSQHLSALASGVGVEALVLSPQGRIEHVAAIVDDGTTTWLITETPTGLASHLDRMRFLLRVEVKDVTEAWAVLGDSSGLALPLEGPPAWVDPWPGVVPGGTSYLVPGVAHAGEGWRWRLSLVPRDGLEAAAGALGAQGLRPVGSWATEAARVWAWRPRAATEVDSHSLPHELDWLRTAVHLDKGCYRGQETVAKVHNVGRPPRRLTFLHLDGSGHTPVSLPATVLLNGETVGHLTSAALHHEAGPIALALLKRGADPSAALTVSDAEGTQVSASQTPIVNPEGVSRNRPPPPGPTSRGLLMGNRCAADGGDTDEDRSVIP